MEDINNPNPLPEEVNVASADGEGSESQVVSIKDVLSKTLGKSFPTDDAALKAVKDTFSYVGKKRDEIADEVRKELDPSKFVRRDELEERDFFQSHPEATPFRDVLVALKEKTGNNFDELLASEKVKPLVAAYMAHSESEKSKSVLNSNPRLGQVKNTMAEARKIARSAPVDAGSMVTGAVLDAFELKP